jgi:hypothetical protein
MKRKFYLTMKELRGLKPLSNKPNASDEELLAEAKKAGIPVKDAPKTFRVKKIKRASGLNIFGLKKPKKYKKSKSLFGFKF